MILCTNCRLPYPDQGLPYRCPRCGGVFDFSAPFPYDPARVEPDQPGIFRYRHALGLPDNAPAVSLGEGGTPLVWARHGETPVALKCEYQNPSGSFKDRGMAPIVAWLAGRGITEAVEDSSGNAGASFAAYAARAGIRARVYIPDSASGPKRAQIEAHGAEVVRIMGPRSNAAEAVRKAAESGAIYASHAHLPFNLPGYATAAYEIASQLGRTPGTVVLPVGQGGLLLGMLRGFEAMQKAGSLQQIPRMVGVQARACAPLWALATYGPAGLSWAAEAATLAEGIRVLSPVRGDAILQALAAQGGLLLAVDEVEILPARDDLARQGFYVEPTSAVPWAALGQILGKVPEPVVVLLTGSGLKTA